jgi:hypothetical protein
MLILFANIDIFRYILVLDTSLLAKSNMDHRREYQNSTELYVPREPIPCQISEQSGCGESMASECVRCSTRSSLHLEFSAHSHTRIWSIGRPSNHAIATWYVRKKLLHISHLGMSICQHCMDMGAADSAGMTVTGCVSSHFCEIVIIMSFSQHKLQTYITWHGDRCAWLLSRDITRWQGSLYQAAICRRIDYVYVLNDCAKH